jgi:hypothetical protein
VKKTHEETKGLDRGMYIAYACLPVGYRGGLAFVTNHLRLSEPQLQTQRQSTILKTFPGGWFEAYLVFPLDRSMVLLRAVGKTPKSTTAEYR